MTRILTALLAVNSVWFAVAHVWWALGWRWGIPASMPSVNERPWFLAYDLVAAGLMFGLAFVADHVTRQPALLDRRLCRGLFIATAVICGVRGAIGVVGDIVTVQTGTLATVSVVADIWFVTTALLAAGVIVSTRRPRERPSTGL